MLCPLKWMCIALFYMAMTLPFHKSCNLQSFNIFSDNDMIKSRSKRNTDNQLFKQCLWIVDKMLQTNPSRNLVQTYNCTPPPPHTQPQKKKKKKTIEDK